MSEIDPATAGTRIAVELLTSWMEQDQQSAAERIERVLNDPNGPGARNLIAGQCNLGCSWCCGWPRSAVRGRPTT